MKLIIDISDEDYDFIKDLRYVALARGNTKTIQKHIIDAIKQGEIYEGKQGEWGKWIIAEVQCPNCFEYFDTDCYSAEELNKCPNCGADMIGGEEE